MRKKLLKITDDIYASVGNGNVMNILGSGRIEDSVLSMFITEKSSQFIREMNISPGITYIGENAFEGFPNLQKINFWNIGPQLTIAKGAFVCPTVEKVYFSMQENVIFDKETFGYSEIEYSEQKEVLPVYIDNDEDSKIKDEFSIITYTGGELRLIAMDDIIATRDHCQKLTIKAINKFYNVTAIAFEKCAVLPKLLENIDSLRYVAADKTLKRLPYSLFRGCKNLTDVYLPNIEEISSLAFEGTNLEYIKVPKNCSEISQMAFGDTPLMRVAFEKDGKLSKIESKAFSKCKKLKEIDLSSLSLEKLNYSLFEGSGLQEIVLPEKVKRIESSVFYSTKLKSLSFPEGLISLDSNVFKKCKNLKTLRLPKSLETLGYSSLSTMDLDELDLSECNNLKNWQNSINNCVIETLKMPIIDELHPSSMMISNSEINRVIIKEGSNITTSIFNRCKINEVIFEDNINIECNPFKLTQVATYENFPKDIEIKDNYWRKGDVLLKLTHIEEPGTPNNITIPAGIKVIPQNSISVINSTFSSNTILELPKEIVVENQAIEVNNGRLTCKIADDSNAVFKVGALPYNTFLDCSEKKYDELKGLGIRHISSLK